MTIFSYLIMFIGLILIMLSVIGLTRVKDNYQMLHIAAINDMLGVPLFLFGLSLLSFVNLQNLLGIKILLLILMTYIVTPISGYILVKLIFLLKNKK